MKPMYKRLFLLLTILLAVGLLTSCSAPVPIEKADVGDYVVFGHYEQDGDPDNGPEEIEWLVVKKNSDAIMVVSRYVLDCQPYHRNRTDVTYSGSSIRSWLNSDFLNAAFTSEEQSRIPTTTVLADDNNEYRTDGGRFTEDKVFLLSASELDFDFIGKDTFASPTKYALEQGVHANKYNHSAWWLRTPGYTQEYAACTYWEGGVNTVGGKVNSEDIGVRPAIWIWLPR